MSYMSTSKSDVLAQTHWNKTPLYYSAEERYKIYPWLPEVAEFTKHANERILEVGCGTGCDLLQFALHGAEAHGIDITEEHLRLARERVDGRATVRFANACSIPYEDGFFDYVYSHGVVHHSHEPQKIVAEILRVLKPGGRFNIHVYSRWSWYGILAPLRRGRNWKLHIENSKDPVHIDLYTKASLTKLIPVPTTIRKYESPIWPSVLGWYLVATGQKPVVSPARRW